MRSHYNKKGGAKLHDKTKILWKFHEISPSDSGRVLDTKVGTDEHTDERMDGFPYYYVSHDLHVVEKLLKICTSLI